MNSNESEMSLLALANVEALAFTEELKEVVITCGQYSGACWRTRFEKPGDSTTAFCEFDGLQRYYCSLN